MIRRRGEGGGKERRGRMRRLAAPRAQLEEARHQQAPSRICTASATAAAILLEGGGQGMDEGDSRRRCLTDQHEIAGFIRILQHALRRHSVAHVRGMIPTKGGATLS